ncbi:hypothetical protein AB0K00_22875 [Dactylosporangium sp. NPDC049525]|uniref:hypothetical protein n=1 Tax=Dactylosporangium sp. NPDC049525 TaxID=3154730 RepID=UPI0034390398
MDHDLHSLLAAARDDAPPPRLSIDDITAAGRQLARRRRRTVLLSSVAGGLAAVITSATAAVVLLAHPSVGPSVDPNGNPGVATASQSPARRADFTPVGAFETNYTGYTVGRFVVSDPDLVTAGYQQSTIDLTLNPPAAAAPTVSPTAKPPATTGAPAVSRSAPPADRGDAPGDGRLVVYGAGAFDPRDFSNGEKFQIAGRTALLRYAGAPSVPSASTNSKYGCCPDPILPTIAWQYLPDSWAAIYWSSFETAPTRDELIALAEALPAADPRPFPTGIFLKDVPKGYRLIAVSTRTSVYDTMNRSVVRLSPKPLAGPFVAPVDFDEQPSIVLSLGVADPTMGKMLTKASCPPGSATCAMLLEDGQFYLQVESVGSRSLGSLELAQILKAMDAGQPDDRSTWPPAVSVFTF